MKKIKIFKYHGAGNDFLMIDSFKTDIILNHDEIIMLCHRHFGIGGDGLIFLRPSVNCDFEMDYYNADGSHAAMCGNGARCTVAFAFDRGYISRTSVFTAGDGTHEALFIKKESNESFVRISLNVKTSPQKINENEWLVNTGVPHFIKFVENIKNIEVYSEGKKIRFDEKFSPEGTNVNFVQRIGNELYIRTYERGVENETLACGTGITASALAAIEAFSLKNPVSVIALGGTLNVEKNDAEKVYLSGSATFVFETEIEI